MKQNIRKSNIMLMAAGAFLVLMLLASIITARVVFDKVISTQTPNRGVVYLNTNF